MAVAFKWQGISFNTTETGYQSHDIPGITVVHDFPTKGLFMAAYGKSSVTGKTVKRVLDSLSYASPQLEFAVKTLRDGRIKEQFLWFGIMFIRMILPTNDGEIIKYACDQSPFTPNELKLLCIDNKDILWDASYGPWSKQDQDPMVALNALAATTPTFMEAVISHNFGVAVNLTRESLYPQPNGG